MSNNVSNAHGQQLMNGKRQVEYGTRLGRLAFVQRSPSYCTNSSYSFGTRGRVCESLDNCDVLCCGRGHDRRRRLIDKSCNCYVIWCCEVKCSKCQSSTDFLTCK